MTILQQEVRQVNRFELKQKTTPTATPLLLYDNKMEHTGARIKIRQQKTDKIIRIDIKEHESSQRKMISGYCTNHV